MFSPTPSVELRRLRPPVNTTIASLVLALYFPLALFGYNTFGPILEHVSPESSTGSVILRAVTLLMGVVLVGWFHLRPVPGLSALLAPMYIFLGFYAARLFENYFVRELPVYVTPEIAYGFLFGSAVLPAIILARMITRISDGSFLHAHIVMIVVFFVGLSLNLDTILSMVIARTNEAMIAKVNAISLANTAFSYALLLIIHAPRTALMRLIKWTAVTSLVSLALVTRSRGPLLSFTGTLLVYAIFSSSRYKGHLLLAVGMLVIALAAASAYFDVDIFEFAVERFYTQDNQSAIGQEFQEGVGRAGQWTDAWRQFVDSPLMGNKVYEEIYGVYPHNLFLESLMSVGILGTLFLIVHLVIVFRSTVFLLSNSDASLVERFTASVLLSSFIQQQFSGGIWGATALWIASACVVALGLRRRRTIQLSVPAGMHPHGIGAVRKNSASKPAPTCQT